MTVDDHALHGLGTRIRALHGTTPRKGLLDALAAEADNLQQRLDDAQERIEQLLEDDGTEAEAPAEVQAPTPGPASRRGDVFTHG